MTANEINGTNFSKTLSIPAKNAWRHCYLWSQAYSFNSNNLNLLLQTIPGIINGIK